MSKFFVMLLLFAGNAYASVNPFQGCANSSEVVRLSCEIEVTNDVIRSELGARALQQANQLVKQTCSHLQSPKLDPELRRIASLQCELETKINFYNKDLVGN